MQLLLKNNLIEVVGRKDSIGKPLLYGTTENFLKDFKSQIWPNCQVTAIC